mgnify:CR=1 FL=1
MASNKSQNSDFRTFKSNGTTYHTFDNKFHNWDGPAVIYEDGRSEYYVYGINVTRKEWSEQKNGIVSNE